MVLPGARHGADYLFGLLRRGGLLGHCDLLACVDLYWARLGSESCGIDLFNIRLNNRCRHL